MIDRTKFEWSYSALLNEYSNHFLGELSEKGYKEFISSSNKDYIKELLALELKLDSFIKTSFLDINDFLKKRGDKIYRFQREHASNMHNILELDYCFNKGTLLVDIKTPLRHSVFTNKHLDSYIYLIRQGLGTSNGLIIEPLTTAEKLLFDIEAVDWFKGIELHELLEDASNKKIPKSWTIQFLSNMLVIKDALNLY